MIYSDSENKQWWRGLTKHEQAEIIATMIEKASNDNFRTFALDMADILDTRPDTFTPGQISAIRKWAK